MPDNGRVTLSLNGASVQAEKGRLLIDVAEELGVFVPRFCYHPGMKSVAVCRMCLVKVEGQRKLLPACATPVDEGMTVETVDPEAVGAQESMLEFLLINHPLDCPICDRGGECPLQDQTYRHGPGSSRYVEPKRTYEKALEISDLVVLDRERCVLCWRCVRFADEIAGDRFIQLVDRGPGTQILTFKDEPFDSYFSGNTIQICPVGALTAQPYRFVSRPWDLKTAPSVCAYCSVGCPITNESRSEKLIRCQALPNENVNDFWNCDKGRFGYHYVESNERLETPLVLKGERFEVTPWGEALSLITEKLSGAERVGVVAGGHLTTEDAFAISRLARRVIDTPHLDSRVQDAGAPYEAALALGGVAGSTATINDLDGASSIVWVGPDPKETLPVLYLRLRGAVLEGGAKLVVVSPRRMSLDDVATTSVRCEAGGEAEAVSGLDADSLGDSPVLCWGPAFPGRDESALLDSVVELATARGGRVLVCPPHAGSQGMIDMGVHPRLEPGYRAASDEGMDTRAILEASAANELDALLVFGADLIGDFPDAQLAHRALESGVFTVVVELFPTETAVRADVVLPSAAYAEREGTFTNLERRLQKLEPLVPPPGTASEPWRICAQLASALGEEWAWDDVDDVWAAIREEVPTHSTVDLTAIVQATPPTTLAYESPFEAHPGPRAVAGPGGQYPKGHRQGAPFQTGAAWPLSWELRAFEATQRPGLIPPLPQRAAGGTAPSSPEGFKGSSEAVPSSPTEQDTDPGAAGASPDSSPSFVLLSGRLIYDEGAMVAKSVALRRLARRPFVEMNIEDAQELGVGDGDDVVLVSGSAEARIPVVISDIARGAVFVPYDQDGLAANTLMSGVDPTVEVRKP
jgi:NADH-quinone oxidoreductase subunit G